MRVDSARWTLILSIAAAALALSATIIRYTDDGEVEWKLIGAAAFLLALGLGARTRTPSAPVHRTAIDAPAAWDAETKLRKLNFGDVTFFVRSRGASPLDGKFVSKSTSVDEAVPLSELPARYWFVDVPGYRNAERMRTGMDVLSTEEVAALMDEGRAVTAVRGPFQTRGEAEQSFERYWEMTSED